MNAENKSESKIHRPLKIGIAGVGVGAAEILPTMQASERVKLVAAADVNPRILDVFRQRYNGRTYPSVLELCQDPEVEAIWVATPNRFHSEHAIMAAQHGKHVVVEKPMAITMKEASDMIEDLRLFFDLVDARAVTRWTYLVSNGSVAITLRTSSSSRVEGEILGVRFKEPALTDTACSFRTEHAFSCRADYNHRAATDTERLLNSLCNKINGHGLGVKASCYVINRVDLCFGESFVNELRGGRYHIINPNLRDLSFDRALKHRAVVSLLVVNDWCQEADASRVGGLNVLRYLFR
jgi:hypothetical protein